MPQINKSSEYFETKLYTGTGAEQSISSLDFSPDLTWIKNRDTTDWHRLLDSVRGATEELYSNDTSAEVTQAQSLKSFDSNGFTLGTLAEVNTSGENYASWSWRGSDSSPATNNDGSITSTVSANTTSGFSIVSYTGTGSNATVGHGLGSVPKMIIVKKRSAIDNWGVYHHSIGNTDFLELDNTNAKDTSSGLWNNTTPTSSVFSIGVNSRVNTSSATYIAYCFAEKKGFSKFGSYTGNGSTDGPFVYTGFKPAFVIVKRTDTTALWQISDNKRDTFNVVNKGLYGGGNFAEGSSSSYYIDYLSNGFKIRNNAIWFNASGASYIYMCFAENPLVGTNNIPAVAR
jgi:hypothetical protein